jgi:multiple sugar transport system permease protein
MATIAIGRRRAAVGAAGKPVGQATGLGGLLTFALLLGVAVLMFVPFLWSLTTSLKTSPEAALYPPTIVPREPTWAAYQTVFQGAPFPRWFFNSALVACAVVVSRCTFDTMAGYAFARLRFPGRDVLFALVLSTLMVAPMVLLIPRFILLQGLGLVNTLYALWLPFASEALGVFMLRQFFLSIPHELEEAARIDGASRFRVFWQIILPNATPGVIALAILAFQGSWNRFLEAVVFISGANRDAFTLPLGLAYFRQFYYTDWPVVMAGAVLTTVPMAVVYVFFQRYFVESIAHTAIKG